MTDAATLRALELSLLDPLVRRDPIALAALLHPSFTEIGASGALWTRDAIVAALAAEPDAREIPPTDEWQVAALGDTHVLVTYRIGGERPSRRSSIWDVSTGRPALRFHQGTLLG